MELKAILMVQKRVNAAKLPIYYEAGGQDLMITGRTDNRGDFGGRFCRSHRFDIPKVVRSSHGSHR